MKTKEKKEEKQEKQNYCNRTDRPCVNGAWDGLDGWGIDCPMASPQKCPYKEEA